MALTKLGVNGKKKLSTELTAASDSDSASDTALQDKGQEFTAV